MRFSLEVGSVDKHLVEFNFNQLLGTLDIRVDRRSVYQSKRIFNEPLREIYHFVIDGKEKSDVRIEKRRKQLFGHHSTVFINDRLARSVDAYF
jgi:hypothetical protein